MRRFDLSVLSRLRLASPRGRLFMRAAFYLLVGVGTLVGWWDLPAMVYWLVVAGATPLYVLALGMRLPWAILCVDVLAFVPLVHFSGGAQSPYVFFAYLWFFGVVLLNARLNRSTPLVGIGLLMLATLSAGGWRSPGWAGFVSLNTLGTGLAVLLGLNLLRERNEQETDPLTGVLHRRAGIERLHAWIARGQPFSVAFVDFKRFKQINDTYGHGVGDEVVCAVAKRLAARVRGGDIVMRYGGDEFVIASDILALCPRLEAALVTPIRTSAGLIDLEADIGEVKWAPGETLEELLVAADEAMYRKKQSERERAPVPVALGEGERGLRAGADAK